MVSKTTEIENSISNQTNIRLRMIKQLFLIEGKEKNMVYLWLSIHVVLSLIAAGTKGQSKEEWLSFLKSKSIAHLNLLAYEMVPLVFADGSPIGGPSLSFANRLLVDKSTPLKLSFQQMVDNFYKAARKEVHFRTKAEEMKIEVNSWAEKETKGHIKVNSSLQMHCTSKEFGITNLMHQKLKSMTSIVSIGDHQLRHPS
ncbi:serpin-ZX-like [Pyrus ussuriensis x Pyrus communis]|uniref:Serpin-ZX-like n=1 Tax=Pyrus ussuriensis x Pyrus communis TaxID=2448454 RepID=A0A5N5HX58_9ROSA|nr:serpin-ZX-like [Pyrus ussuriensis x Pyrus communis]